MSGKWFFVIALVCVIALAGIAQQQQSGGGGGGSVQVTAALPTGANTIGGVNLVDSAGTNKAAINASGQLAIQALPTGSNTIGTVNIAASQSIGLSTGSNVIGKAAPLNGCGTTTLSQAFIAVPTSATAVATATTCVQAIVISNTNATAQTVTITDNAGTPLTIVNAYSIPPNSQVTFPFYGAAMTSGVKWTAGGTGLVGAVIGNQ